MKLKSAPILALFVAAIYIPTVFAGESVVVAARETAVTVEPQAAHSRLIKLPALEFALRATFKCAGESQSLTLSIADSYTTLDKDAITGQRSAEASVTVPARQLALAASSNFCISDDMTSADELLIPGMATAHASLRCRNEDGLTAHFASAPLHVRLLCSRPSDEDQEPSPAR